ncbi:histidine kinase hhk13p [Neofusicoccum parvum]|uniref:Histidine kinase hhk13p n=1 Tax=Neofusicoccum parvum TaxID=310453 RepID=A0ACB5RS77_9PEZI|nr:histidine kinase hhk13p [Neofusicoccum parvum]
MNNPPSIFTGLPGSHDDDSSPDTRRLSTPEYRATLQDRPPPALPSSPPAPKPPAAWLDANPQEARESDPPSGRVLPPARPLKSVADSFVTPSKPAEKRSFACQSCAHKHSQSEPLHKRRKLHSHSRSRHTLDSFDFAPSFDRKQPPSPLFFSHTKRVRPQLPARFSSSEAAARMLSNAREDSGIKTVTLARGTYTGSSPSTRTSVDRSSLPPGSPEIREKPDVPRGLSSVGIGELLEQDGRPTFIVDLGEPANYGPGYLNIVFANSALRASIGLLDLVTGKVVNDSQDSAVFKAFAQFKTWALSAVAHGESLEVCIPGILYSGLSWTIYTLRKRYRVISGSYPASPTPTTVSSLPSSVAAQQPVSAGKVARDDKLGPGDTEILVLPSTETEATDYFGLPPAAPDRPTTPQTGGTTTTSTTAVDLPDAPQTPAGLTGRIFGTTSDASSIASHPSITNECVLRAAVAGDVDSFIISSNDTNSRKEIGFFDWTRLPIDSDLPQHIQFARSVDWASTPLGPIEFWSADLRQMCNLIMASPHPAAMYWGDDLVAIYNEAYVLLAGQKHPTLMGQSYRDAWAEIWDDVKDVFAGAKLTGQATMKVSIH